MRLRKTNKQTNFSAANLSKLNKIRPGLTDELENFKFKSDRQIQTNISNKLQNDGKVYWKLQFSREE